MRDLANTQTLCSVYLRVLLLYNVVHSCLFILFCQIINVQQSCVDVNTALCKHVGLSPAVHWLAGPDALRIIIKIFGTLPAAFYHVRFILAVNNFTSLEGNQCLYLDTHRRPRVRVLAFSCVPIDLRVVILACRHFSVRCVVIFIT